MKKHLIATAVAATLAGPAMAQTVTISGVIESGYISRDVRDAATNTDAARQSTTGQQVVTPTLRIRAEEDLGGGLRAFMEIMEEFDTSNGNQDVTASTSAASSGIGGAFSNTFVGVTGGFGTVQFGKMNHATRDIGGIYRFFGDVGRLNANLNTAPNLNNTIQYTSPSFNGFNFSVGRSTADKSLDVTSNLDNDLRPERLTSLGLRGTIGKLNLGISTETTSAAESAGSARQARNKLTTYGGSYDFGVARVGAVVAKQMLKSEDRTVDDERNVFGVHVAVPMGNGWTIGGSSTGYKLKSNDGGAEGARDGAKATINTLVVRYDLSKRTSIFGSYQSVANNGDGFALGGVNNGEVRQGRAGGTRGLGVQEVLDETTTGYGLTIVHTF